MCTFKKRRVLAVALIMVLTMISVIPANAAIVEPEISPQALYYTSASADLGISGSGEATVTGKLIGNSETTKVKVVLALQKYSGGKWTVVDSWSETKSGRDLRKNEKIRVASGYQYRTQATFTVYSGLKYTKVVKYSGTLSY